MLGFTPNSSAPEDRYAMFGIGRSTAFNNYWWEGKTDYTTTMDFVSRTATTVTLYISYDAWYDTLYLGDTGYGEEHAWQAITDFTSIYWGRVPFYVFLAATTENMAIKSGTAYIDNFVIEKGKIGSPYPSTDPNDSPDDPVLMDVEATVSVLPSTIRRRSTGDRITAVVTLPKDIKLVNWDPDDIPTLSPGNIAAGAQGAFVWADGSVKILAAFSKSSLLSAVKADGETTLYLAGTLRDGRTYAGHCTVIIE